LIYFHLNLIEDAKAAMFMMVKDSVQKRKIDTICDVYLHQTSKNPQQAKVLSYVFPGLGQLYTKQYKSALNSFVLNGLLGYSFVVVTLNYNLLNAVSFVSPWLMRYYVGGAVHAKEDLIAIHEQLKQKSILQISNILKNSSK
jgi:hypothetical protein